MYVTYKPEDGQDKRWEFDPGRVRASKAEMIERRFGENWDNWKIAVQQGNMKARRVLLWHLLTLEHPALRWEDTPDFLDEELDVDHSVAELQEIRDRVAKRVRTPGQHEEVLAALDYEITEAMARDEAAGTEPEGKASSNADGSTTP